MDWFIWGLILGGGLCFPMVAMAKRNKMLKLYPEQDLINEIKRRRVEAALIAATEKAVEKELE
jgi:hypothetical protein